MKKIEIKVTDNAIHCEGCEERIGAVLGRLPGVLRVTADYRAQLVKLNLDETRSSLDEVRWALDAAGYPTE